MEFVSNAHFEKSAIKTYLLRNAKRFCEQGNLKEAGKIYRYMLSTNPSDKTALFGFGLLSKKLGNLAIARKFLTLAIDQDKEFDLAYFHRGQALFLSQEYGKAVDDFTKALTISPSWPKALNRRGTAYFQLALYELAIEDFDRAIDLCPNSSDLYYNRALVKKKIGQIHGAEADNSQAISLNPNNFRALNNRGLIRKEIHNFEQALKDFESSVNVNPNFSEGFYNLSLTHLTVGNYISAWKYYEYRWLVEGFTSKKRHFTKPNWLEHSKRSNLTILLHSEQGLGDSIQMLRYVKLIKQMGHEILIEVEKPLISLVSLLIPREKIFEKDSPLPDFDVHCPLMSLPLYFQTTKETIPFPRSYVTPPKDRVNFWRGYFKQSNKKNIGLVWRGNPNHTNNVNRSIELQDIIDHLPKQYSWFCIQKDPTAEEQRLIHLNYNTVDLSSMLGDFQETGSVCAALDAILCVDTSIAHLAGALGVRTHILLSDKPDARWHLSGSTTPWYLSVILHRKKPHQSWQHFVSSIKLAE